MVSPPQKRDAARKKHSDHVRSLVSFVKGMDKRAMKISMQARAIAGVGCAVSC
jgi:hypothetical protein